VSPASSADDEIVPHPRETLSFHGHTEAEQAFLDAYRGRMPHAWLIGGPRGIGKATLAYRMARFVFAHPDPTRGDVRNAATLALPADNSAVRRVAAQGHSDLLALERREDDKGKMPTVIPVDLVRNGSVPKTGHGKPVFALIPYTYIPDTPAYVSYLDTYVIPQVKGWQQEGVLASYSIYITRYQTDRPWNALFVLEYDDEESLGRRDPVMAKVRARLRESNPEWKAASEHKQDIRHEHAIVLTEEILPE